MTASSLPAFKSINTDTFLQQLSILLTQHMERISTLLKQSAFTWSNLIHPLEAMDAELEQLWAPLGHLHAVINSPALRQCYEACLPLLTKHEAAIAHNLALFQAIETIEIDLLSGVQKKIITDILQNFKLAGVHLSSLQKQRFAMIQERLSDLSNQFDNQALDATDAFYLLITEEAKLAGIPQHMLQTAQQNAVLHEQIGWRFTLQMPCYLAIMTYADDRSLRETIYHAYVTRASDVGPHAHQYDNAPILTEILALRHEKALLLGFNNYAELSVQTKMVHTTQTVTTFLQELITRSKTKAQQEWQEIISFAQQHVNIDEVFAWDVAYLSEKMRTTYYQISEESLRNYFPLQHVMQGLIQLTQDLFGMQIVLIADVEAWHPDVRCYQIFDEQQHIRGYLYLDLFARANKRGGAWMDALRSRFKDSHGTIQLPIATITCNFARTAATDMSYLSHDEVNTLFHEFGHALHHTLTQVDEFNASGIHGVEWDAVELPSQFLENWCWDPNTLISMTEHKDTKECIPENLITQLLASKIFQSSLSMMRQLQFADFDFQLHLHNPDVPNYIDQQLNNTRQKTAIIPIPLYNRFQNTFAHIFSGGYAAGYYSYKWAEVLSADAFSRFEEDPAQRQAIGRDFLQQILEQGGGRKAEVNFIAFRGRAVTIDAFLRHLAIS